MKCFLLFVLLMMFFQVASAQEVGRVSGNGHISGKVLDSLSRQPVDYAVVSLYNIGVSKPVAGTTTDSKGQFKLDKLPPGEYKLVIYFLGYKTKSIAVRLRAQPPNISLDDILLVNAVQSLASVMITGKKGLVENKVDKLVYNAEKDITSQGGVATDILKKVPMISVDVDGNVELQGSSTIQFLINGRPSTLFGNSVADALQSIPASQIQSIEVITNPGAKYDAQGTGGIINIVLKHNTVQGINGNVSLTTGTIMQNGSFNLNARKGNFGLNAFVNGNARLTTTTPTSFQRVSTDTAGKTSSSLQQNGSGTFNRHGLQSGIGFDWTLSEKNSLSGGLNYSAFGNRSNSGIDQLEQIPNIASTNSINTIVNDFSQHSFDPNFDFKHNFDNKEQQLEIAADGSFGRNLTTAGNNQYLQPLDSLIYGTRNNNPANENQYETKLDYVQPLDSGVNFGLGGRLSGYDISSIADVDVWNPSANRYLYKAALSNNLNYHQKVYAAYAELNFPIGRSLQVRLGGRYERTQIHSFYGNSRQEIDKGYNTFIPSVFLMKKIGETQTFKLSYTIRINRPDYSDLNPFINTSNPQNIITGNPDLKPEIWDRYEASYNNDLGAIGSFMITLYYRQSNGDIQPFMTYYPSVRIGDSTYTNTTVTTNKNIGIEKNAGANFFFDLHLTEKFEVRSNLIWFYRYTINQVDIGYNSNTTIFRSTINASYQFANTWSAEFFGAFSSHHREAQGYYPSYIAYSMAIRKQFWNKKGSIALTANNIFSKYADQRTSLYGPGFVSNSLRQVPYQSVGINFTWKFGKLEIKKEKEEDNIPDLNLPQQ